MSYSFQVPKDATVTWIDANGQPRTQTFAKGGVIDINDPCEAYRFSQAYTKETGTGWKATNESVTLGAMQAACSGAPTPASVVNQPEDPPQPPAVQAPPLVPGDDTLGDPPSTNPPENPANPDSVDTTPPPEAIEVTVSPTAPGVPDGRPVEQRAHDPQAPLSDAEVSEEIAGGGDPSDNYIRVRHNDPTPGLPHYHFGLDDAPLPSFLADPVDVFGGAYQLDVTDFAIPGVLRPLRFVRRYRSGVPKFGPWGYNWDHNFNAYLRPLDKEWVAVWTGLLNEDVYRPTPEGGWVPPLGVRSKLEHHPVDIVGDEHWTVTTPDGTVHRFERPLGWPRPDCFPLVSIVDRFGNAQQLTYDAGGRLSEVRDDLDHTLLFSYGHCGFLEAVTDHTTRAVRYFHDEQREHLVMVSQPPTDEAPEGARTLFEYHPSGWHPMLRHNITRVVAPDGCAIVELEYEDDPSSDDFSRVVAEAYAGHVAAFRATRVLSPARVPDAINISALQVESIVDGQYRVSTFNYRGGLLEERYRLVADGSWRLVVEVYRYDERGNLSLHRHPNGLTERQILDTDNDDPAAWSNLLEMQLDAPPAKPAPSRRTMRMTYEPRYQEPHTFEDESGALTRFAYGHELVPGGVPAIAHIEHPDVTLPDGTIQKALTRFEHDARGRLTRLVSPEGRVVEFHYGLVGNDKGYLVKQVRDPNGIAAVDSFTYDQWGNVATVTDAEDNTTANVFDARNRIVRSGTPEVDGAVAVVTFQYHPDGPLAEHHRPRGDAVGLPATETEIVTRYDYDVIGRLVRQVDAANSDAPRHRSFCYDADGRVVARSDALGRTETTVYDERGGVIAERRTGTGAVSAAAARELRLIRDLNGQVLTTLLPGSRRIDWTRDSWDRLRHQDEPEYSEGRARITHTYGDDDLLTVSETAGPTGDGVTSGVLARIATTYDERGRVLTEDHGSGPVTHWHDADGLVVATIDASGARTELQYDAAGRLITIVDAVGNEHRYEYDRADHLLTERVIEPLAAGGSVERVSTREYDARGQQRVHIDPLGRRTEYHHDLAGRQVGITTPAGSTVLGFNPFGELVSTSVVVGGSTISQTLERDSAGRVVAVHDATGQTWQLEHDVFDALIRCVHPDGSVEEHLYADDGTVGETVTPGGSRIIYHRRGDGILELIELLEAGASLPTAPVARVSDALGRPTRVVHGASTIERAYDLAGRILLEVTDGVALERAYDDVTRLEYIRYSDGRLDRLEIDELGRLRAVVLEQAGTTIAAAGVAAGTTLAEYDYEGSARLVERRLLTGARLRARYDLAERLVELTHEDAALTVLTRLTILRDTAGRSRVVAAEGAPWENRVYTHDEVSRMVRTATGAALGALPDPTDAAAVEAFLSALVPAGTLVDAYDLDGADSRIAWTQVAGGPPVARMATFDPGHRLAAITTTGAGTETFTHDTDLRRATDGLFQYHYDAFSCLREVRDTGGSLRCTLTWDGLRRLHGIELPGGDAIMIRRVGDVPLERVATAGLVQEMAGFLPGESPLYVAATGLQVVLEDQRGSSLLITDGAGVPIERHSWSDFGGLELWDGAGVAPVAGPAGLEHLSRYAGLEHVVGLGLHIGGERAYHPTTGRFLQPDPIGIVDSADRYVYAKHSPVDYVDASGRWVESAWDAVSLGIGVYSLRHDLSQEKTDWWAVGLDLVGIAADTTALILPVVPGGAGAAIKASRAAATGAQVVAETTRLGRSVRAVQAAVGAANAVRGGFVSYEAAKEGRYWAAAAGMGLSVFGFRSSLSRLHLGAAASPSRLFSMQGDMGKIIRDRRIWGMTEGRVWGTTKLGAGAARTGKLLGDLPEMGQRVIFEFQGEAARVFRPVRVWGIFSGLKALGGQRATGLGDVRLDAFEAPSAFDLATLSYRSIVTGAEVLAGKFAGQSAAKAWTRAAWPVLFDMSSNLVFASLPAVFGYSADLTRQYEPQTSELRTPMLPDTPQLASLSLSK
jgi:RHS repeat-associated protein